MFFTIYFGFINLRRFPLAINVVRGKFDHVDHHEVDQKAAVNVVDGDAVGTKLSVSFLSVKLRY